jgi:hypothetical protein
VSIDIVILTIQTINKRIQIFKLKYFLYFWTETDNFGLLKSVCPSVTTWVRLNRYSWNLILGRFTKICQHFPILIKWDNNNDALHEDLHPFPPCEETGGGAIPIRGIPRTLTTPEVKSCQNCYTVLTTFREINIFKFR